MAMTRPDSQNNILINGQPTDSISIHDRGLQYGDGLFETIAVVNGQPLLLEKHLSRLTNSADLLKFPNQNINIIKNELFEFSQSIDRGIIKIILTRGVGGRGYGLPTEQSPNRILVKYPWPDYPQDMIVNGVKLRICDLRLSKQAIFFGSKHLNRLEQVMARSEWSDKAIFEGLLLDENDKIIECTMSNVFFIKDKTLFTPELNKSGVKGILREVVLEHAEKLGFKTTESSMVISDLNQMEECFITNSIIGICPVNQLSNIRFNNLIQSKSIREHLIQHNMIANI